jgi:hypothetical protein
MHVCITCIYVSVCMCVVGMQSKNLLCWISNVQLCNHTHVCTNTNTTAGGGGGREELAVRKLKEVHFE